MRSRIIGLVLIAMAIGACGSTATSPTPAAIVATNAPTQAVAPEPTATSEPTATPAPTPEPTAPPPTLVPLGTAALAGTWEVTVTGKVNFDAWKVVKAENMFNDPAPKGMKMVLIPLAVTNRGDAPATMLGEMGYVVGDANGIEISDFDPSCGVIPKELDAFTTIRVGGTLKGNMCFVVDDAD